MLRRKLEVARERMANPLAERGGFGGGRVKVIEGLVHGSE